MIEMKESGAYRTREDVKEAFPKSVSESAIRDAWLRLETLPMLSREEPGTTRRLRRSTFSDVDLELRRWYNICAGLGAKSVPLTMEVLRQRAEETAASLGATGFSASAGFVLRWAKRLNIVHISLWGTGGSAACSGRGVPRLEGARPLSCGQHTPGAGPKISRSGPARE